MYEALSHDDTLATPTSMPVFLGLDLWICHLLHARRTDNNRRRLFLPPWSKLLGWRWRLRLSLLDVLRKCRRGRRPWTALRWYSSRLRWRLGLSSAKFVHRNIVSRMYLRVIIIKCPCSLEEPSLRASPNKCLLPRTGATIVSRLRGTTTSFFATTPFSVRTAYPPIPIFLATVGSTMSSQFPSLGMGVENTGIASTSVSSVVESKAR